MVSDVGPPDPRHDPSDNRSFAAERAQLARERAQWLTEWYASFEQAIDSRGDSEA